MTTLEVIRAWQRILAGRCPSLSIEITRECPLRCPGCYAYEENHLGGSITLRQLADTKGDALVAGVLELVDSYRPLHLSLVGGDPLVRYRELEILVPMLTQKGVHVQIVTSAFRALPASWAHLPKSNVVVSIDGLQPEHDIRRAPATYERILQNISGHRITIHCTITSQMMRRPGYLEDFLRFWTPRPEIVRVWMSIFTPQKGTVLPECLTPAQRRQVIDELSVLRGAYPKLDMAESLIREFSHPPRSPDECIFAQTTQVISADLKTHVKPCQFGGNPDCSQCGCMASMGLAAVGHYRLAGLLPVGAVFRTSRRFGSIIRKMHSNGSPFHILPA